MEWASGDLLSVIAYLLPGFLAAAIFHGLTAHKKSSPFERVVQALIFTVIVQASTTVVQWGLEFAGQYWTVGEWTASVAQVWSLANAFLIGLGVATIANRDWAHSVLRKLGTTRRTWHPSEWFTAFCERDRYIILHLEGARRLRGWPYQWPDHPDNGHFMIAEPHWMLDDNSLAPLHTVQYILVPATSVEMIEFLKAGEEITASETEISKVEETLVALQKQTMEEPQNGKQSTSATAIEARSVTRQGGFKDSAQ